MGQTWTTLHPTLGNLKPSLTQLGSIWDHLGPTCGDLGPTWEHFGATLNQFDSTWPNLVPTLCQFGATLAVCGLTLAHFGINLDQITTACIRKAVFGLSSKASDQSNSSRSSCLDQKSARGSTGHQPPHPLSIYTRRQLHSRLYKSRVAVPRAALALGVPLEFRTGQSAGSNQALRTAVSTA